jgi:predicted nucleotidyltransferase
MVAHRDKQIVIQKVEEYIERLRENHIDIWRLYLYGSYAKDTYRRDSDIDLAIFLNKEDIDGFDECRLLMNLRWDVDLSIEPHCFAKSDFDENNPYIKEIIQTGMRFI